MRRRHLLVCATSFSTAALLDACAGGATTDAQVLADATGIVNSLLSEVPLLAATAPAVVTPALAGQVIGYLTSARTLVLALSSATPAAAGASTLAQVEGFINQALAGLTAITPAVAAAYPPLAAALPIIAAVNALLPVIEAFVNTYVPAASAVHMAKASAAGGMDPVVARKVLGIPTVK
jgi:hypothetical protein